MIFNDLKIEKYDNFKNIEIPIMTAEQGKRCYEHKKFIYSLSNENDRIMYYDLAFLENYHQGKKKNMH